MFGLAMLDLFTPHQADCPWCGTSYWQLLPHLPHRFCTPECYQAWSLTYPVHRPKKTPEVLQEQRTTFRANNPRIYPERPCACCDKPYYPYSPANTLCPNCQELTSYQRKRLHAATAIDPAQPR